MLFQMSNQDESTSGHWLQRVYPYTICGGVLGFGTTLVIFVCFSFVPYDSSQNNWIMFFQYFRMEFFLWMTIGVSVLGTVCGLNVIFRKVSEWHHFANCGGLLGVLLGGVWGGLFYFWFPERVYTYSSSPAGRMTDLPFEIRGFVFDSIIGSSLGVVICALIATVIGFIHGKFQQVFKTRLLKFLGSIFAVVFTVEFLKADTHSNHPKIWEGILSGGWHGAVAVFMVLGGVVLWKLATKDAPKPD